MQPSLRWFTMAVLLSTMTAEVAAQAPAAKVKTRSRAPAVATTDDIRQLREALAAQQQQIQQLRAEMEARTAALLQAQQQLQQAQVVATDAQQKAALAETLASEQKNSLAKLNGDLADVKMSLTDTATSAQDEQKRVSALEGLVGRFRLSGDIRVRGESFFQDFTGSQDRNRARVRVRFGVDGKLNEDFTAGFALATGSLGDPTTTNETFNNFFDRKTIGLDRGFIAYNPVAHRWVSAIGGKFAYQWQRTAVTGDPDLNPEGFDVKLSFDTHQPLVKNVSFQALNYLFNEVSSGTDSYALGGQAQARLEWGPWTATPSFLAVKWQGTSALLQASGFAVQANKVGNSTSGSINGSGEGPGCAAGNVGGSPLPSTPLCAFASNGMTNAVVLGPDGKTPRFLSGFFYADFILVNQIKTGIRHLPLNVLLEFEDNLDAASHPIDSKGNVLNQLGSQDKAYQADISLGQLREKNDLQFGYAWLRQEQDSVLASFAESDQRAPTNILQNRFYALWRVRSNTVASFTYWYGRTLNSLLQNNAALGQESINTAGQTEPYLKRLQFDLIYTF